MADLVVVEVAESVESLAHDESGLSLGQVLLLGDVEEKFTTFAKSTRIINGFRINIEIEVSEWLGIIR